MLTAMNKEASGKLYLPEFSALSKRMVMLVTGRTRATRESCRNLKRIRGRVRKGNSERREVKAVPDRDESGEANHLQKAETDCRGELSFALTAPVKRDRL
jgi:hypothetical protein